MRCALLATSLLLLASPAKGQAEHVRARLVSEHAALTPGASHTLAVRLDVAPGWHVYWLSPGDTGMPTSVAVDARSGPLEVGPLQWPAPRRYVHEGGELVDFVHEGSVLILVPVTVAEDAAPGSELTLTLRVSWLVCNQDACIPGSATPTLRLRVASDPGPKTEHAPLFAAARTRLPSPAPATLSASWEGRTLVIRAAQGRLEAYPQLPEDYPPESMRSTCASAGPELRLPYPAAASQAKTVRLLLGVFQGEAATYHWVELEPPPEKAGS